MVLGDHHHVARAGGGEARGPVLGVPAGQARLEVGDEGFVPLAVVRGVEPGHRASGNRSEFWYHST